MGSCCSTPDRVEPVNSSGTQLDTVSGDKNDAELKLPVRKRQCTDVLFFILLLLFLISLVVLISYCAINGDIYRTINGYDNCGNICGRKNAAIPQYDTLGYCKGEDMTSKKYLQIAEAAKLVVNSKNVVRSCVTECSDDYATFLNRCIPKASGENVNTFFSKTGFKNFFQEVAEDLQMTWREILCLCLISFGMSIILLLLFRFLAGMVVWLVLIGVSLASIAGTIFLWILWKKKKDEMANESTTNKEMGKVTATSYLAFAIVATLVTVIVLLVILVMRKRIKLVVQLFKEAGRAIHNMPLLLLEPILTFTAVGCVVATWMLFSILIESSGFFTAKEQEPVSFEKNMTMKVTRWYNLLGLFWFTQFCIACQHMIIAGSVAAWYFTRNKSEMESPISWSFYNLVRYHLGTAALGSLLIALVQLVRVILAAVQNQVKGHENAVSRCLFRACQCCLYCFEKILKFLSRNAYIETAMYGYSFCRAGQQAFKQLTSNALRVAAINSVGDFVLFLGKALVVVATVLLGIQILRGKEGIQHIWIPLTLAGIFAYLISHCFITVYEMAIDTIFLCFCEDCEQNDGLSRPYYMSRGLMEFVQNSKKALSVADASNAWSPESARSLPSVSAKTNQS